MTVNGGVVIYRREEDKQTRIAAAIHKVSLAGVEERIRQVVGCRVAPVPELEVLGIVESPGDGEGVIVAIVPPLSLAPHQAGHRYLRDSFVAWAWVDAIEEEVTLQPG
jgi:hypothetical protein